MDNTSQTCCRIVLSLIFGLVSAKHCCANSFRASAYFDMPVARQLAEAAADGNVQEIDQLLSQGANINERGKVGMTPLIWSIVKDSKVGFAHLLDKGADPNLQMDEDGYSATSIAAMVEDPGYLAIVLKHRGNPNLVNRQSGRTPIYDSIVRQRQMQIDILIAGGADLNFRDRRGITPMCAAAGANEYDVAYRLLKAGADPTIGDYSGATIVSLMRRGRIDPKGAQFTWKQKVAELLKAKGLNLEYDM